MEHFKFVSGYTITATSPTSCEQTRNFIELKRLKNRFKTALFMQKSVILKCCELYANKLLNEANNKKYKQDFTRMIHNNQDKNANTPAKALNRIYSMYYANTVTATYLLASNNPYKYMKISKLYSEFQWKFSSLKEFYDGIDNPSPSLQLRFKSYIAQRDLCIKSNMRLGTAIARNLNIKRSDNSRLSTYHDDMLNEAMCGLMIAVDNFDVDRGFAFSTFAINWIQQSIRSSILQFDTIKKPSYIHDIQRHIFKNDQKDDKAIARDLDINIKLVEFARESQKTAVCDIERIQGYLMDKTKNMAELNSNIEYLAGLLKYLDKRQLLIVQLYFFKGMTLQEAGDAIGVTRERIRQILSKAISKMRNMARVLK